MGKVILAIVDDLFGRFGAKGYLEWDPDKADSCNEDWAIRMLRMDMKAHWFSGSIPLERLKQLVDEIYVVESILRV